MTHRADRQSEGLVLVVDDHRQARESITDVLQCGGFEVACAASAPEAIARMKDQVFDVVVTDLQMPGMSGLEFIRQIESWNIPTQIVMVTAHASIASAVDAMRHGAFDYIEKPFQIDQLETCVRNARDRGQLLQTNGTPSNPTGAPELIGSSPAMQRLRARIAQIAPTEETVLIHGESGVGKELVAGAIHAQSPRKAGAFACLNCPVLSAQLMESELFGHIKGAFTGADSDRIGRFQMADGGTLLLDEVTEIDLHLQAKLLRVLQERSFEPVGSSQTIRTDVRVLATTNRNLPLEIAEGRFREDLYYRLAVIPIEVPPLRDRPGDVAELTDHFLDMAAQRLSRPRCELDPSARDLLAAYSWPGNVRELQNIITRACVLCDGKPIMASLLHPWLAAPDRTEALAKQHATMPLPVGTSLEEMERHMIEATLDHFDGHRARTAAALGIGVRTLCTKLRSYGYAPREKSYAP